ncbi:hypothetical protein EYF80_020430 [Liparis tanakae]|uniref:Uncharacterized protein n=1 Tax=Liparis tanakae TaxID=230148 RepID=A0A4Z2HTY7_9TELE|nr:hypothetical protein EYF80_020430 [Liparis tanakae]
MEASWQRSYVVATCSESYLPGGAEDRLLLFLLQGKVRGNDSWLLQLESVLVLVQSLKSHVVPEDKIAFTVHNPSRQSEMFRVERLYGGCDLSRESQLRLFGLPRFASALEKPPSSSVPDQQKASACSGPCQPFLVLVQIQDYLPQNDKAGLTLKRQSPK